jgi:hypothetical protein
VGAMWVHGGLRSPPRRLGLRRAAAAPAAPAQLSLLAVAALAARRV